MTEEELKELEELAKALPDRDSQGAYLNRLAFYGGKLIRALREEWEWKARFINDSETYKLGIKEGIQATEKLVKNHIHSMILYIKGTYTYDINNKILLLQDLLNQLFPDEENLNEDTSNKKR